MRLARADEGPATIQTRHLLATRHGYMHVRTVGAGGVPLLLLHMSPLSGDMWAAVLPLLSTDRLVVVPDRIGFGDSDRLGAPMPFEEYALATLDALDALEIEQVDVLGIHTGACEAIELASMHPARIRRIAVLALPALDDDERARFKADYGPPPKLRADGSHLQVYWRWWDDADPDQEWPTELIHERVLDHLRAGPDVWWTYHAVFDYPAAERIPLIGQPFLVLAPHDDLWEPTKRAAGSLPSQARYVELPHLGYEVFTLAAEEMADRVRAFLDDDSG
jgi:pimeloyl-ACP methyl ester carboxylesterase